MEPTANTLRGVRQRNRSVLLSAVYLQGPLSRLELSRLTGLSTATVSTVTGELIGEGLLVEAGLVGSDGGRPRVLLRVDPNYGHLVGVDVGETGVIAELFDLSMTRVATVQAPASTARPEPQRVVRQVAAAVAELLARPGLAERDVVGVGVGVPGTVERGRRCLVHAQALGWDAVPFLDLLSAAGVRPALFVDNGAKAQGQAELWFGAARGARDAVVALVGSGVSAAVIANGRTYQGATSSAGEWGHTVVAFGGRRCRCGARGCLEAYVGGEAILDRYRQARHGRPAPGPDDPSRLAALIAAAPRSRVAAATLADAVGHLGAGLANLVNLFNPERIVLGGWAGLALGRARLPQIRAATAAHALCRPYAQTTIELCHLGPDSVAVGAATLPMAVLLDTGADPRPALPRRAAR